MKKILIIVLLTSCGRAPINNHVKPTVVTAIELTGQGDCLYHVTGDSRFTVRSEAWFFDECGKYTVGDTVKITKL